MTEVIEMEFASLEEARAMGPALLVERCAFEGLRLLEERELKLVVLRQEIEAGRKSGESIAFDADAIKCRGRKTPNTEKSY